MVECLREEYFELVLKKPVWILVTCINTPVLSFSSVVEYVLVSPVSNSKLCSLQKTGITLYFYLSFSTYLEETKPAMLNCNIYKTTNKSVLPTLPTYFYNTGAKSLIICTLRVI